MYRSLLRTVPQSTAAFLLPFLLAVPAAAQDQPGPLASGATAPDFLAVDIDGTEVRLSGFRDKVVVLDFWATWCTPCLQSLPHVQEIAKANDVVVFAVCTSDTRARFESWVRENQADYPDVVFACDPNERGSDTFDERASSALYHVAGLPTKFVVGRDGKIALTIVGHQKDDLRLEAGLARAGVTIDAALAKRGEEQVEVAIREAAARAAEAAARPARPLFFAEFGYLKANSVLPEFTVIDARGEELTAAALLDEPTAIMLSFGSPPLDKMRTIAETYSPYGVRTVLVVVATPREEFDAWIAEHPESSGFAPTWDPAGKYVPTTEPPAQEEQIAHHRGSVLGKLFGGGMYPGLPIVLVANAEGRFVGGLQFHPRWADGLANLLLHAGVELEPEDMPEVIAPAESFEPRAPRAPEPKVEPIAIGTMAPDFTTQDLEGGPVQLADYRGKVIVLDFWATWCGPCKAALPHVQHVAAHYRDQGVVVLASCTSDGRSQFEQWVRERQADYPDIVFAHDAEERKPGRASRALYGVSGIPAQFVIDRDGRIVAEVSGYREGEVLLDAALAKAGIEVDPEILEKAAEDQKRRDQAKAAPAQPAIPLIPVGR